MVKGSGSYERYLAIFLKMKVFIFISKRSQYLEPQDKEVYLRHVVCLHFFGSIVSIKRTVETTML